jgi:sugar diacid utilization regulator
LDDHTPLDDPAVIRAAQLAEHAGAYLAQLSRQHRDDAYAVSDLLSADLDKVRLAVTRIGDRGLIDPHSPVVAVVVGLLGARPSDDEAAAALAPNLWSLPRSVLADRGPTTTTLLVPLRELTDDTPAREAADLALRLYAEELAEDQPGQLVAGIGEPRADIGELRTSWVEARQAARVAAAVPAVRPVAHWADLGIYRLLAALPPSELAALVLDAPVRRLLNALDTDLVQTIRVYLDHAGNVQDTAAELHIHRQTLYYRLNKAESLTGLRLSNGHDRSRLHIGLMLAPLLDDR